MFSLSRSLQSAETDAELLDSPTLNVRNRLRNAEVFLMDESSFPVRAEAAFQSLS
jgi:hypothetical protein